MADVDGPKIGDAPPSLTLSAIVQGPPASQLSWAKLKGKVVVLEFWATWCPPCIRAIPHLNALADQFKDKPVVFISVTAENPDIVRAFLKNHSLKTWIGVDDYKVLNEAFHVQGIPHAVIVDTHGRIAAITHPAQIQPQHLEEVLAGKKCSVPELPVDTINKSPDAVVPNQPPALFEISIHEHPVPEKIRGPICMWSVESNRCAFEGRIATVESALQAVFDKSPGRRRIECPLPGGYYDFELRAPAGHFNDLRKAFIGALRTTFGLEVKQPVRETDVYLLTQVATHAPGFRKVTHPGGGGQALGGFQLKGSPMTAVVDCFEAAFGRPVLDESGLEGLFHVDMKWKLSEAERLQVTTDRRVWKAIEADPEGDWISALPPELRQGPALEHQLKLKKELAKPESDRFRPSPDAVIAAARERLGLQLTPARRRVEILEVSQAPE